MNNVQAFYDTLRTLTDLEKGIAILKFNQDMKRASGTVGKVNDSPLGLMTAPSCPYDMIKPLVEAACEIVLPDTNILKVWDKEPTEWQSQVFQWAWTAADQELNMALNADRDVEVALKLAKMAAQKAAVHAADDLLAHHVLVTKIRLLERIKNTYSAPKDMSNSCQEAIISYKQEFLWIADQLALHGLDTPNVLEIQFSDELTPEEKTEMFSKNKINTLAQIQSLVDLL